MRKKPKVYYLVEVPGHWYYPKLNEWVKEDDLLAHKPGCKYWELTFKNLREFKTCRVFRKKWPSGTRIMKASLHKGKYLFTDYIVK